MQPPDLVSDLQERVAWLEQALVRKESQVAPSPSSAHPLMLPSPVLLASGTDLLDWITIEGARFLPAGSRIAWIQGLVHTGQNWQVILGRTDSNSHAFRLAAVRAGGDADTLACLSVAPLTLAPDLSFQLAVTSHPDPQPDAWREWQIWLWGSS
ncbi:MAG: hypothetical protein MUC92_04675 [Fimbriimonadaceae bacterium]|jgi:hypothetical protein|nr:hypothetical protein [Fimbriimonadaceae bacterium]